MWTDVRGYFDAHIVHPTDCSDNAEDAFTYVEKLVESGCPAVTVLHSQGQGRIEESGLKIFNEKSVAAAWRD